MEEQEEEQEQEQVIQIFKECEPNYKKLASNLREALKCLLDENKIAYLDVYDRVKDINSFVDKISRKNYQDPFKDIEDICGLRIVCYYPNDVTKIKNIIYDEFVVHESQDKGDLLEPDKFGYRSYHIIIEVKREWLKAPNFRGLGGLKAELQIRTILMHAWADVSHKLSYKKKEHIPPIFQRKLFQLSALFEIADDRFETLRKEREEYKNTLFNAKGEFDINQELNLDSLSAFLDYYFIDKMHEDKSNAQLLDELIKYKVSLNDLFLSYIKIKDKLPEIEQEVMGKRKIKWSQTGVVRHILCLTNDPYWIDERRRFEGAAFNSNKVTEIQRKRLSETN